MNKKGILSAILSAVIFGLLPLFTNIIYAMGAGPKSVGFYRVSLSLLPMVIIQFLLKNSMHVSFKEALGLLIPSLSFIGTIISLCSSYNYIGSGLATSLHFLYPSIIFLLTTILTRSRPKLLEVTCLLVAMISIFMLMGKNTVLDLRGIFLAILSAFTYSIYSISLQNKNIQEMNSLTKLFFMNFFACIFLLIYVFMTKTSVFFPNTLPSWLFLLFYSVILTIGATFLYQKGVELIGAKSTANLSILEPVVGVLSGMVFMEEKASFYQILAIVLILLSTLVLVNFTSEKEIEETKNPRNT